MSSNEEFDSAINILEPYVLSSNKEAYIKTLVPNSTSHRLVSCIHALNSSAPNDLPSDIKVALQKLNDRPPASGSKEWHILTRYLLSQLAASTSGSEAKRLVEKIDSVGPCLSSRLQAFSKPVIFSAGEEFKEAREHNLKSDLSEEDLSKITVEKYVKQVYIDPTEIIRTSTPQIAYHLDLHKVAVNNLPAFEHLLNSIDNYANLSNVEKGLNFLFGENKKKSEYYRLPQTYFQRLTLDQLRVLVDLVPGEKTNEQFSINLFNKTFDVLFYLSR